MILEALLIAAGSAVIAGATMMTKDKDRIIQPTTINNIDNSVHNNNCNNSYKKTITTSSRSTETKVKDSYKQGHYNKQDSYSNYDFDMNYSNNVKTNKSHTTQQSAKIDHDKIIDELYARYKLERNEEELNELLEKLNNLK